MMKAWIDNKKGIGYVVMVTEGITHTPLRNFGEYLSAAMEFRDWLNRCRDEKLERWVKDYAATYDPNKRYSYPEWRSNNPRPTLPRQRDPFSWGGCD